MMTMAEDVDGVARAVNAGARGYLVKDASREELTAMVTQALADVAAARQPPLARTPSGLPTLTERELQVLRGMGRGRSNSEIGKELYLSEDTVKTHARRLFRKLGAADRAQAVAGLPLGSRALSRCSGRPPRAPVASDPRLPPETHRCPR